MGANMSYLNVHALSEIVVTPRETVDQILVEYDATGWSATKREANTLMRRELLQLLDKCDIHIADKNLFNDIFILLDVSGFGEVNIRDIAACFSILVPGSLRERMQHAFRIHACGQETCDKYNYLRLLKLLNSMCCNVGDRGLADRQLEDLVDSIYTLIGRIDGHVLYSDFMEVLFQHPLLEMFVSKQYQNKAHMQ